MSNMNEKTPTTLRVPKGSVKRIMKMDDEVKMVAADAVFLMGKACVRSASQLACSATHSAIHFLSCAAWRLWGPFPPPITAQGGLG